MAHSTPSVLNLLVLRDINTELNKDEEDHLG